MPRNVRTSFLYVVVFILASAFLYRHYLCPPVSALSVILPTSAVNYAFLTDSVTPPAPLVPPPATAVLMPDWEVLVVVPCGDISAVSVSPPATLDSGGNSYVCVFQTGEVTPARFRRVLPRPDRVLFRCPFPRRARRRLPFVQPVLKKSDDDRSPATANSPEILRFNYLVYDSLTTDDDVVLFAKGVNSRQGINREPAELRCVFGDDAINAVRTDVTSSVQEVFRCKRPELTAVNFSTPDSPVKLTLEIVGSEGKRSRTVPSLAHYNPTRKLANEGKKSLTCAATMVYNVSKFLKEWVLYHSRIGVEKFVLYDNDSGDDLRNTVDELVQEGYDVVTNFWPWPKTQEAGFSHIALYTKESCSWMAYLDVDEFMFSPSWVNSSEPSESMLQSLLPLSKNSTGQISIGCHEFGPSDQKSHPVMGVTQGYNCRKRLENHHKSIVLLEAVDDSLVNVIHHFALKQGYKTRKVRVQDMVVKHYKYQAWPEFRVKFRRRVSAYVTDWRHPLNVKSKDRTPGLGCVPVEPKDWTNKFCEVHDNELKDLARRWFGFKSPFGYRMAWQR